MRYVERKTIIDVLPEALDDDVRLFAGLGEGARSAARGRLDRTADPRAHGHAIGLGELPNDLDRRRGNANRHVLRQSTIGATPRPARRGFPASWILVVLEGLGV